MTNDADEDGLRNAKLTIGYDGRGFRGWQRLRGARTVQGTLEDAATAALKDHGPAQGASRTDRGVHAEGQVVSMRLPSDVDVATVGQRLRAELPDDLWAASIAWADPSFHAREDAVGKDYRYVLWNAGALPAEREARAWAFAETLDLAAMEAAARVLVGAHDFGAFAKRPRAGGGDSVRVLSRCSVARGEREEIVFRVSGNSFLFRMVRNLVSALVRVGQGRWTVDRLRQLLTDPVRPPGAGTAPPDGLYLDAVHYPDDSSPTA